MKRIHILAFIVPTIWAAAFIITKNLITSGLLPMQIMLYRFIIAYICMLIISPKPLFANSIKDELLLLGCGVTGGTLYFLSENTAIQLTQTSNVGIIIALAPLLTAIASHIFINGERITKKLVISSIIAFSGVILVVCNGQFILNLNPLGDILALSAAATWAIYSVLFKLAESRGYNIKFITRKLFFYGIVTLLPLFITNPIIPSKNIFTPTVIASVLFLAMICSFACFFVWGYVVKRLGAINSSRFIYIMPVVTLIASSIFLNDTITLIAVIGSLLIMFAVIYGENHSSK